MTQEWQKSAKKHRYLQIFVWMELLVFLENWEPKVTSNHDTYEVSYGPLSSVYDYPDLPSAQEDQRYSFDVPWSGALLMHEAQVVRLWVSFAETHPETLIDNESNHLRHQSLNLGVAYVEGD